MEDLFKVPGVEETAGKSSVPKLWDLLRKLMTGCKLSTKAPKYSVTFGFLTVSHDGGINTHYSPPSPLPPSPPPPPLLR